jgi:hypothetical protein
MRIALYIGDELYPGTGYDPSTISTLQQSPLTSPILSLLNASAQDQSLLVYNGGDNPVFTSDGDYVGSPKWPAIIQQLRGGGNIQEVYLSFSTNGTQWMANVIQKNPAAAQQILSYIKNNLYFDGIDLDDESGDYSPGDPIYTVAYEAIQAGLKLTAAPFFDQPDWQSWVAYVQGQSGTVSWLNLQCYAGGKSNSPADWLNSGCPIVPGSCSSCGGPQTTCSPQDMQDLFTLWAQGPGHAPPPPQTCWDGVPNTEPLAIGGGFIWVYSSIKGSQFSAYMNAVATGLGVE